uniref:Survival of motor neuron-related-splicing factor 30 n=1 Tax=Gossypium raimondii TaxID=29730 RepID=A0A0D2UCK0_GOSRA|nr:hypothetical protein B456_010G142900 [Gossypium raimondii]
MQGTDELSIDDLASSLSTYKEQLQQVRQLLADDPGNAEYVDMEKELAEVIALTEELLATAKQNEISGSDIGTSVSAAAAQSKEMVKTSDYEDKFPVGTKVQAVWSEDGEWYDATIEAVTPNGYYASFDGWGNKEEVDPANVRAIEYNALLEAEKVAEATKQAIKRKIAQAASVDFQSRSLPAKLRITSDDPEDVQPNGRRYMLSSQRCDLNNLKWHKISGRMLGSSFRQPKARLKRLVFSRGVSVRAFSNHRMILKVRLV